jgi:hypothetical protein
MGIDLKQFFVDYELEQMTRYLTMVKKSLAQEMEKLDIKYKYYFENEIDDDVEDEFLIDEYTDGLLEIEKDFPKLTYGSFVVAWYSFTEQTLLDICESNNLKIVVSAKGNDSLGRGIWRAKKFLSEAAKFEIDNKKWQELVNINRLRNFIVHEGYKLRGSYIENDKPFTVYETESGANIYFNLDGNLYRYLEKNSMISHSGVALEIIPTYEYCNYLIGFAKPLFKTIFDNLKTDQ